MELSIEQITHIYNIGYNSGHNDTVEGCDLPAHHTEMEEHQRDVVEEILEDIAGV